MTDALWDPFVGEVDFHQQSVAKPHAGIKIPGAIRSIVSISMLIGMVLCFVAIIYRDALWLGVPLAFLGAAALFGIDHLANKEGKVDWLLYQLAKQNNWAFKVLPKLNGKSNEALLHVMQHGAGKDTAPSHVELPKDHPMHRVRERVSPLFRPKVGRVTIYELDAFFWGKTQDEIPFWMAMGVMSSDMTLAAKPLKTDKYGNTGNQAYMIQMLCAYRLDRDTDIRARLLHESVLGQSWTDFQTESVEFNRQFNISVAEAGKGASQSQDQALLQALSPATQATLIELKKRYDVQVIIDGDTVFYSGWDQLNSTDFSIFSEHIKTITETFAESSVSFKQYVE